MTHKVINFKYYRKRSKYGSKTATFDGYSYHSKKECKYAQDLALRVKAGDIKSWDRQFKISLDVNGFHICNYYIDFRIHHNDGSRELVEVKGFATDLWRLKWKLAEALLAEIDPDATLTLVK